MKTYVDWAVKQGFAVIDVNLPKHVTDINDGQEHEPNDAIEFRTKEAALLLTYLWDNYVELSDATHVFLMGTNTGHGAIINFIKANEGRAEERVNGAISFVEDVPLQSCKSATNDLLAQWYYTNSLVFVANDHNFWHSDLSKKPKKRFGKANRSNVDSMTDMLIEYKTTVQDLLLQRTADWSDDIQDGDAMDTTNIDSLDAPKPKLPPVGNFAPLSRPQTGSASSTPSLAVGNGAAVKPKTPPIGNFAPRRPSKSPFR